MEKRQCREKCISLHNEKNGLSGLLYHRFFVFISESSAVGDGQEAVFCKDYLPSLASAYRTTPVNANKHKAADSRANIIHLQPDIFICDIRISPLFEGNMKGNAISRSL